MNDDATDPDVSLDLAVNCWVKYLSIGALEEFRSTWLVPECPLLMLARQRRCNYHQQEAALIDQLVNLSPDHIQSAVELFIELSTPSDAYGEKPEPDPADIRQLCLRLWGNIAAVQAGRALHDCGKADQLTKTSIENARPHLLDALEHFSAAMPMVEDTVSPESPWRFDNPTVSLAALYALSNEKDKFQQESNARNINVSGWLSVARLLSFILGEDPPLSGHDVVAKLLLYDEGSNRGVACATGLDAHSSSVMGVYLDPVAMGLMIIDHDMQRSLQSAWKISRTEFIKRVQHDEDPPLAVRVAPRLKQLPLQLSGGSAGLILASGLCALAEGKRLNAHASATAVLQIPPSGGPLWDFHLGTDAVADYSVLPKLAAACEHRPPIRDVILSSDQAKQFAGNPDVEGTHIKSYTSFKQAYAFLTRDDRCERVLADYSRATVEYWQQKDQPPHYIEPHFGILQRGLRPQDHTEWQADGDSQKTRQSPYTPVLQLAKEETPAQDEHPMELETLFHQGGKRLAVTEDAGAGKTVFSKRGRMYFCSPEGQQAFFGGLPGLAVRWESREETWPDSAEALQKKLVDAVTPACTRIGRGVTPDEVVEFALANQRVVIFLDAFDQVVWENREERLDQLWSFFNSEPGRQVRLVLTSRAFAVAEEQHERFPQDQWRFATIFGFDETQQADFFDGLFERNELQSWQSIGNTWLSQLFPNYEDVKELLSVPVLAAMAREMADQQFEAQQQQLPVRLEQLRTRGDFYRLAHQKLEERARKNGLQVTPTKHRRWQEILAATAMTFMLREKYNYAVVGMDPVANLQEDASAHCATPITEEEWKEVKTYSNLTEHCIMDGLSDTSLSWKHRGWMEYFAGIYLARFNTDTNGEQLARFANRSQWYWGWRFAIEMAEEVKDAGKAEVLGRSLSLLLRRPQEGRWPTELIYRAWHLLDGEGDALVLREHGGHDSDGLPLHGEQINVAAQRFVLPGVEDAMQTFRDDFWQRVEAGDEVARSLVPERKLVAAGLMTQEECDAIPRERRNYARCPEEGDPVPFTMGSSDDMAYEDEQPPHSVLIREPFWMLAAPVTRQQFALFDGQYESDAAKTLEAYAKSQTCPAIEITWYDVFCFAKWVAARVPTEAQWEYACRAGSTGRWCFGNDETQLGDYAWYDQNAGGSTHPVREKQANDWGLYDMHGNVYEWCWDWFSSYGRRIDGKDLDAQVFDEDGGGEQGSSRVLRGGFFDNASRNCRSSRRRRSHPALRDNHIGFRLLCRR